MIGGELDTTVRELFVRESLKEVGRQDYPGVCGDLLRELLERIGRPYPVDQRLRYIGNFVEFNEAEPGDLLFGYGNEDKYNINDPDMSGIITEAARYANISALNRGIPLKHGKFVSVWGSSSRDAVEKGRLGSVQERTNVSWGEGYQLNHGLWAYRPMRIIRV